MMEQETSTVQTPMKKEISAETFIFIAVFLGCFGGFVWKMGLLNAVNTLMNTAYSLVCNENVLIFRFYDGSEVTRKWKDRSRSQSWTDEMKAAARQKALDRRRQNA